MHGCLTHMAPINMPISNMAQTTTQRLRQKALISDFTVVFGSILTLLFLIALFVYANRTQNNINQEDFDCWTYPNAANIILCR